MIAFVLGLLLMTPAQAAEWVPAAAGRRSDASVLMRIAWRESRQQRIGVHRRDVRGTRHAWANAVLAGHLTPAMCPFHRRGPSARPWGTRGSWGHVAAFAMQYLPCLPPWVLDIPVVSAKVALDRLDVARRPGAPRALRAWAMLPTVEEVEREERLEREYPEAREGSGRS